MAVDPSGEVLARGNMIMEGYWAQPEATADAIKDGYFHTGDGGSIDEFNYVTISDRKKDVIISGGENVSSIEVEDRIPLNQPKIMQSNTHDCHLWFVREIFRQAQNNPR